ncbi:MAG TPA: PAS domain S-box protein, partial [Chroococcales cyanobacterium]
GIGIPENELPRLFERFHRVPGARGRTYEGSGIGLSLVQELVRLHGGSLRVASVEGQGSCFTVSIPAGFVHLPQNQIGATQTLTSTATQVAAYVEEALRWLPEEAGGAGGEEKLGEKRRRGSGGREELMDVISLVSPASPARILLVDDNADIRDYVRRLLSRDYEVEAVSDGLAALDAVQRYLPDLVLTDIMMPRLDGLELLRSLRNDPATQNIPIILLSARAGEESRVEGLEAGADDYLIKPFSARELLARVRTNLELVRLRQETVRYQEQLRVEAQAAQSQVSNILESITDAFVAFDREWRYTYVNEYATRLLRKKREELLGKQVWTEVFPELVGTKSYWEYHRAIAEQVPIVFEKFSQPMGVWVEVNAYPFPDGLAVYFRDITHRKQAEQALRESEERFRQLAENIDTVFFMSEGFNEASPGRVIYVSPAYERIWGRSCESLYQNTRSWLEAIHPGDRERIGQALPGIARAEFDQEFRIVRSDGEIRWVRDRIFPVYNERGEVYRTAGIVEDITDRKQAEVALQESESRFRNIADHSPIMIWMSAPDGAGVWFNQQWCEFTGQTLEEALGSGWVAAVHPEDAQSIETTCLQAHQRHEPVRLEYRLRRRDGEYRWVFDSAAPRFDDTGVYLGYIGSITDISDVYDELRLRKQAEAELQQTFQTLSTLITASPLPIVVIEPDMTVHLWNPAAEQLFGWSEAEVLGQPIPIVPEEKQDECRQVRKAVAKGEVFAGVETYRCKRDGATVIVSISAAPLSNEEGSLNAVLLIFQDITERKAVEEEREQLLLSEQRAREEAERANRIKDEFLAVLSHELRSPLNPILGWAKLLQSRSFDEQKTKHALATIERNALLQAQLIEDLLDVSRILQGKLVLNTAPVSLTNTIEAALETVRLAADAKDIQLQCVLDPNVGQVMGESARLQQVIWNLLSNAVKFTPSGGTIEIRLKQINTHAQLQVKDTGKGITREFLPHVFEYFRQEDGTTTRKFGGLGLGLAIVRHLAELHGGTVWAESPGEGQGAIFTVRLPLMPVSTQTPQDNPQVAPIAHLTGLRILVVDDQPDIRDIVAFILEQAGAAVSVAASAPEALNLMEQFIPDLLICDIGMPDIDGYMLMRQIRTLPPEQGGKIPAIALTAYAGEFDRRQALQVGFQKHMSKPVEPEELVKAIVNLVEFV